MSSSSTEGNIPQHDLMSLGGELLATIWKAKELLHDVETKFSKEFWPAFLNETAISKSKMMDLEATVKEKTELLAKTRLRLGNRIMEVARLRGENDALKKEIKKLESSDSRQVESVIHDSSRAKGDKENVGPTTPNVKIMREPMVHISPNVVPQSSTKKGKMVVKEEEEGGWRSTRNRAKPIENMDLHDSFLDTPMQDALAEIAKKAHEIEQGQVGDNDNKKTTQQDLHATTNKPKGKELAAEPPSIKHNLAIRKKKEREELEGTLCKECGVFYDAVADKKYGRGPHLCEHLEASRHRYKHVPPDTPPGFWDLRFPDSLDPQ